MPSFLTEHPWWSFTGFLIFAGIVFPLIWCLLLWLLSHLSGWARLARHYESNRLLQGKRHTFQSARFGLIGYSGVLTFFEMPDGLGLSIMPLFSTGHPNLVIPWSHFQLLSSGRRTQTFQVGNPCLIRLTLRAHLLKPLAPRQP